MEANLTKEDIYLMSAKMMETNAPITQDHLVTFVRFLNKDILRQDNNLRLLQILQMLLLKIKDGTYPKVPLLSETVQSLTNISMYKSDVASLKTCQFSLEILLEMPDDVFRDNHTDLNSPMLLLLESHLSTSEECRHLIKKLLEKYLSSLSQNNKEDFAKVGLNFFLSSLIPSLFLDINDHREFGIDLTYTILPYIIKNNYFNNQNWLQIYDNIANISKYPKILLKLLNNNDPSWHRLWIMITKIAGKELHRMGKSINPFLGVLQEAFKKSPESKCNSFYCLKALIDNFNLDKSVLFTPSRVKVLSIALEINNAKTENVALVKFEVWWHLITVMKSKIFEFSSMIFLPFLKFCFGETDKNGSKKSHVFYPGKSFESIQKLAIKSLTEIFGHFDCSGCSGGKFRKLNSPLIDLVMLESFSDSLINALKQSTKYAVAHIMKGDKTTFEELKMNVRCMWWSFVHMASDSKLKNFSDLFKQILTLIMDLVKENSQDELFAEVIMTLIIPSIVMKNSGYVISSFNDPTILLSDNLIPIQFLIRALLVPKLYHQDTMSNLHFDFKNLIEIGFSGDSNQFSTWLMDELTSNGHSPQIWCCLSNMYVNNPEKITFQIYHSILTWPINKYSSNIKITDVFSTWCKFYNVLNPKLISFKDNDVNVVDDEISNALLKSSSKVYKNEINLVPLFFLPFIIRKNSEANPGKMTAINRLLIGLEKYFVSLNSAMSYDIFVGLCECLSNLATVLSDCYSYHVTFSSNKTTISLLNKTVKQITIYFQKSYQESDNLKLDFHASIQIILNSLNKMIIPVYFSSFREELLNLLDVLLKNVKNSEIERECTNLLKNLMDENIKTIKLEKSDLIKIKLILNEKSKKSSTSEESPQFSFPAQIKCDNTKQAGSKEDEFIVIKSNWKFDPKNLTEHQKEMLKRRRDDIPALYEDLSQSQDEYSMKTWRLPGSKAGENSNSVEQSSQDIDPNYSNLKDKKSKIDVLQKQPIEDNKQSNSSAISGREKRQSIADNFKDVCSIALKNNVLLNGVEESPDMKDSNKLNVKITNSIDSKSDKIKKKSILSRLNESLQSLKSNDDKNTIIATPDSIDETINCSEDITTKVDDSVKIPKEINPNNKKVIIIKKDSVKKISEIEEQTKNLLNGKLLDFQNICNDDKVQRKRKASDELENPNGKVIANAEPIVQDNNIIVSKEVTPNKIMQKTVNVANRPSRVRRKPNKFLSDDTAESKNLKTDSAKCNRLDLPVVENTISNGKGVSTTPDSKNFTDSNIFDNFGTPKSSKKKSRLLNQLVINTKEGHPLMEINEKNPSARKTRRSLGMTTISKNTAKSPMTLNPDQKIDAPKRKKLNLVNDKEPDTELDDIENSQSTLDKPIRRKVSAVSKKNITETNNCALIASSDSNLDKCLEGDVSLSVISPQVEKIFDKTEHLPETLQVSTIEEKSVPCSIDKNNECSETVSIFSQETEIEPNMKIPLPSNMIDDPINMLLNNREPLSIDNSPTNFNDCSPDCIESSQDETSSSMSLKIIMSKSKTDESKSNEKNIINSQTNEDIFLGTNKRKSDFSMLTTQELADADTQILSYEPTDVFKCTNEPDFLIENKLIDTVKPLNDIAAINIEFNDSIDTLKHDIPIKKCDELCENISSSDAPLSPVNSVKNISILSSPCKDDVDERHEEFLNDTIDISPIKIESNVHDSAILEKTDVEINTPPKANIIPGTEISPDIFTVNKLITSRDIPIERISPPKNLIIPSNSSKCLPSLTHLNSRTAQMLNMCMLKNSNDESPLKDKYYSNKKKDVSNPVIFSEKSDVQPLFELKKIPPCLTASPGGPILKRKWENDDLTMSPSSKKKRVSFHDPIVSTTVNVEKYIGSNSNMSPSKKEMLRRKNNSMAPRSLMVKLDAAELENHPAEPESRPTESESHPAETENRPAKAEINTPIEIVPLIEINGASISDICSLVVDLPQPVEIAQNDLLDDKEPIYPFLIDCESSISEIASLLSSSLWTNHFVDEIKEKIKTIGDLAKLTATEVNRLPIKYPKVETVKRVLTDYDDKLKQALFSGETELISENKIDDSSHSDSLSLQFVPSDKSLFNEAEVLEDISRNLKKDDTIIADVADENSLIEVPSANSQDVLPVLLSSSDDTYTDTLTRMINEKPEEALKIVVKKFDPGMILNNIPFDHVISYLKMKVDSCEENRQKVVESFSLGKVNNSKKQNLDNSLILFRNNLCADFDKLLNSINKYVDS